MTQLTPRDSQQPMLPFLMILLLRVSLPTVSPEGTNSYPDEVVLKMHSLLKKNQEKKVTILEDKSSPLVNIT